MADKVLSDEAVIHHVEEETRTRADQRVFVCLTFCQDPSRIPQTVYLTLLKHEVVPWRNARVHFVRPRNMKKGHVFKILIHIDVVEDLMFYQFPREELLADGKVPWRDFHWQFGRADGELEEDELLPPPTRFCCHDHDYPRHPRDDDDHDREHKRSRPREILRRVLGWIEGRGKPNSRCMISEHQGSGWYRGESSGHCGRAHSPPNCSARPGKATIAPSIPGGSTRRYMNFLAITTPFTLNYSATEYGQTLMLYSSPRPNSPSTKFGEQLQVSTTRAPILTPLLSPHHLLHPMTASLC